ncbi:hypothetical protein M0804_002639 [Polistes exclamans]|nr:hypothetical protein M0804_002639 [Polistes exclamans]
MDKKTSNLQDLLKNHSSTQSQKTNNPTVTTPSKQISQQESKNISNSSRNELPIKQTTPRPKMELPGKIADSKVHLQALKVPPNGVNKDMLMQKNLLANANGIISRTDQEDANVTNMRNNPSPFDRHTQCMNQANLPYERIVEKEMDIDVGESNMEDRKQDSSISETLSGSPWKMQNVATREEEKIIKDSLGEEEEEEEEEDVKINGLPVSNESTPGSSRDDPRGRSNSENKDLTVKDEAMNPEPPTSQVQNTNVHIHVFPQGKQILGGPFQGPTLSVTGPCSSIPKPTALVKGTSKPPKENNGPSMPTPTKLKGDILHRAKLDPNTVAMVSPMPSFSDLMSESSHSNSNSTGQSNSSDSSVIYRPSSESGSEIKTIPNRKIDTTFEQMEKVLSEGSTCGSGSGGGGGGSLADDEAEMTVKPMQPLLRGYTPGARALQTLPSRTTARQYTILHSSSHHHVSHDYADIDIASGYLSDGEVLRGGMSVGSRTLSDLCDGYMSEGGASLYARRINPAYGHDRERYVGGSRRELSGVKELVSSRRVQKRPSANTVRSDGAGGGCIVGGAVGGGNLVGGAGALLGACSGGSDALAELTIEELASIPAGNHTSANHTGHSTHHKKVPGGGGVIVGGGGSSATPQGAQQSNNLVYRVVSSRHPGSGHHPHTKKSDSSQQTESSAFKHQQQQQGSNGSSNSSSNSQQWRKYIEAGTARDRERDKEGTPTSPSPSRRSQDKHRKQTMAEYANGEKAQKVSSGTSTGNSSNSSGSSNKVRGVPQSFGYVKRHSAGTSPSPNGVQNGSKDATTRTAQVKVSGGTQTCTTELQANSSSSNQGHHYKSYSLTGPSASQLSQSVRDRLMLGSQSLPKPGSPEFTALFAAAHYRERGAGGGPVNASFSPRVLKPSDGSLSDTCSNYAAPDLPGYYTPNSPYATSWMRHSNTYTPSGRSQGMGLCEADSVESLGSHRASLTHARLLMHQRDSTGSPAPPRLNRSNSIRSTKSEKMYPSMLARGSGTSSSVGEEAGIGMGIGVGVEPYYSVPVGSAGCTGQHWSQPTSPTPTHTSRQPPNLYQHVHKDDDIHGSSVSLVSTTSSLYSSAEEKQAHELRKLRRELLDAQEKVHSLTSQLSTNVCSRQVHDGYATIRSRGRNRPRPITDSEENLIVDSGGGGGGDDGSGSYTLGSRIQISSRNFTDDDVHRTSLDQRWMNNGKTIVETYGTLRAPSRKYDTRSTNQTNLKTFRQNLANQNGVRKEPRNVRRSRSCVIVDEKKCNFKNNNNDKVIDNVEDKIDRDRNEERTLRSFIPIDEKSSRRVIIRHSGLPRSKMVQSGTKKSVAGGIVREERKNDSHLTRSEFERAGGGGGGLVDKDIGASEPIYALPNNGSSSRSRRDRRAVVVDGNYVQSGDLYRTTVKYIEDVNKNIAEIENNYKRSDKSNNSSYGMINKISKDETTLCLSDDFCGYLRNRGGMVPMPPISPNFGENFADNLDESNEPIICNRRIEIAKSIRHLSASGTRRKIPPSPSVRSSSLSSTSRHSTGSTTTSSTKSTDSLHAIDESTNEKAYLLRERDTGELVSASISDGIESKDDSTDDDRSFEITQRTSCQNTLLLDANNLEKNRHEFNTLARTNLSNLYARCGDVLPMNLDNNKYGTLPYRRSKERIIGRSLHKSIEDVLDRTSREKIEPSFRACSSSIDVSDGSSLTRDSIYPMDATDVILKGQLERSRLNLTIGDTFPTTIFGFNNRTRHDSFKSDTNNDESGKYLHTLFATLPRRGNISRDQVSNDSPRRLSGNVTLLEPLYEHAVSDPVKPRSTDNVIPWWELATRKYRHRSCPSLQAHVVSAFEQSLSNMTQRLQQLTATAEKKDSELQELRETIERLRKQSAEAGLNNGPGGSGNNGRRHTLGDSDSGNTGCTGGGGNSGHHQGASMARQLSADSVTSLNSLSSACSASSSHQKKKGWLRSSFSKAFSRSRKNRHGSVSDAEDCKDGASGELSVPNSPRLPTASKHENARNQSGTRSNGQKSPEAENPLTGSKSSSALYKKEDEDVDELKKQLREKDLVLTDIRLEALSSAHQLESLKDTVIKMRNEMLNLKQNNERLQRLVTSKSLTSSQSSLPSDPDRRFSMTEVASSVAALSNGESSSTADQLEDLNVPEHSVVPSATSTTTAEPALDHDTDGKRINVAVYLGSEKNFNYNLISGNTSDSGIIGEPPHCVIANVCISNKTSWDALDSIVRRCFKEYVSRVDPVTNLGLGIDCVAAYHLGEASRCTTDSQHPELLPCGYLIGHVKTIYLVLSGYSWLAIDTLIPRSIVQRLISLLTEHRRVILCGPSGTGKSYLAGKLAHALVDADTDSKDAAAVATFIVDHKSSKELKQYLAHIAERCDSNAADELPRVIILENLQHAASLGELFSGLLGTRHSSCPAIIGTMSQATCSTTNLQLHHNFRWVLCANHMEPVKGFLGRYLRRKLLEHELRESGGTRNAEMAAVVEWLPRVWLHLNKFLETHSSSDVTIGPRLFLSCPMEVAGSQVWFTDLWNYSVIPYLVEAVREGLTLYGRRASGSGNGESTWEDPAQFITSSYPWISTHAVHGGSDALLRLRPEDVGYDVVTSGHTSGVGASSVKSLGSTHSDTEGDPLLNMLMRLQEAANYSSPHSNDSDSVTSLDSSHTRHSEDLSSSTSSSRGVESAL